MTLLATVMIWVTMIPRNPADQHVLPPIPVATHESINNNAIVGNTGTRTNDDDVESVLVRNLDSQDTNQGLLGHAQLASLPSSTNIDTMLPHRTGQYHPCSYYCKNTSKKAEVIFGQNLFLVPKGTKTKSLSILTKLFIPPPPPSKFTVSVNNALVNLQASLVIYPMLKNLMQLACVMILLIFFVQAFHVGSSLMVAYTISWIKLHVPNLCLQNTK